MRIFETHSHLDFPNYNKDREQVISDCFKSGIEYIINVGIDYQTSVNSIELADKYDRIYASVGFHPHEAKNYDRNSIIKLLKNKKVVAIGEIGLDYFKNYSPKDVQLKVFEDQIKLAMEHNLPLIIHNRSSDKDSFELLSKYSPEKLVYHCFSGDETLAKKIIEKGWIISFTGTITYKNSTLENIARFVPKEQFFVETDSPFLSPNPHRGKRNTPKYLSYVIQKLADIRRVSPNIIADQSHDNAKQFFLKNNLLK